MTTKVKTPTVTVGVSLVLGFFLDLKVKIWLNIFNELLGAVWREKNKDTIG